MAQDIDEKPVFMLAGGGSEGPIFVMGIPAKCWEYMKDGKTSTYDLTRVGMPIKIMLFGGDTHESIIRDFQKWADEHGAAFTDMRDKGEFKIKEE